MSLSIGFKSLYSPNYISNTCSFAGNKSDSIKLPTEKLDAGPTGHSDILYFNTFVKYVNESGYKPGNNPQNIYVIGCGNGCELPAIHTFFNGKTNLKEVIKDCAMHSNKKYESKIEIKAIDSDVYNNPIAIAERDNKSLQGIEYIPKDAIKVLGEEKDKIDVVIMRHPKSTSSDEDDLYSNPWAKMFKQSYEKLREGGIIFITTYTADEKALFEKAAKKEKMNVIANEGNSCAGWGSDGCVFVVKK